METEKQKRNRFKRWIASLYTTSESFDIFNNNQNDTVEYWLGVHYVFAVMLVFTIVLAEFFLVFIFDGSSYYSMPAEEYRLRFFIFPVSVNLLVTFFTYLVCRFSKNDFLKAIVISFMYSFVAFITYTVHIRFPSLEMLFCLPMFFSVVYGNLKLTSIASIFSIGFKTISDVFFHWEEVEKLYVGANDVVDLLFSIWELIFMFWVCVIIIRVERKKHAVSMKRQIEKEILYHETMTDALTGIFNRNGLRVSFDGMLEDHSNMQYILVMMDMDHFKNINDTYGHSAGDEYLKAFSKVIDNVENATAFRFGGDEFCLLYHGLTPSQVEESLKNVQAEFDKADVCNRIRKMTMSFGVAVYDRITSPSELIKQADEALYAAKENRGSIRFYEG